MRIVSLLPSATEIVYALGLGGQLVGVTFECDEPPSARTEKAVVVGGRDTAGMTPAAIDAYVRAQLAAGEDLYTLQADALAALAPDLILTQDLCRVCALPAATSRTHSTISAAPPRCSRWIRTGSMTSSHDRDRRRAGRGRGGGGALVAALRRRLAAVADRVAGRRRPSVAVIEWTDPPFTAGHWVPDLVTRPAAARWPPSGRPFRADQLGPDRGRRPEVVVVAPCGFHLDAAAAQAELVARRLPGCRCGRSTRTGSSSAPAPASSTASRRSPLSSTPTHRPIA